MSSLSDSELIARLPALVQAERRAMADVIEHLVEVERRRLYLAQATSSLYRYCIERLGYPEDAALKRHRVARLALRLPQVLGELRSGAIHLTGLFLLSTHLTEANAGALLAESRGKSRRQIEELIARWFPRPDVPPSVEPVAPAAADPAGGEQPSLPGTDAGPAKGGGQSGAQSAVQRRATCSGAGKPGVRGRLEPLSESRCRVEFTARAELRDKLERARELSSHSIPSGDLGELFERALDALIEKESRKRHGAGRPRKPRKLKAGSRHVPVEIARAVWERDGGQCTFCRAHNLESERSVFGNGTSRRKYELARSLATTDSSSARSSCSRQTRGACRTRRSHRRGGRRSSPVCSRRSAGSASAARRPRAPSSESAHRSRISASNRSCERACSCSFRRRADARIAGAGALLGPAMRAAWRAPAVRVIARYIRGQGARDESGGTDQ